MFQSLQLYIQSRFGLISLIEIAIITVIFYFIFTWVKGTQAEQVVKGLIVLLILLVLCQYLGLSTLTFIIQNILTWIFLLIIVVFQPELRSILERIGNTTFKTKTLKPKTQTNVIENSINSIVAAAEGLSNLKEGALIVCQGNTGLKNFQSRGTKLNAKISTKLIISIFLNKGPLHDGAVILDIDKDQIEAAGCILPIKEELNLPTTYGTRHIAGYTLSEITDALIIVVSEETGNISVFENGEKYFDLSRNELKEILVKRFLDSYENRDLKNRFFFLFGLNQKKAN